MGFRIDKLKLHSGHQDYPVLYASANERFLGQNQHGWFRIGAANSSHLHMETDRENFYFYNSIQNAVNIKAPIYYDINNTGFYVDPASTSNLNGLKTRPIMLSGAQNFDSINLSGFYNLYNTDTGSTNSPGFPYGTMLAVGNALGSGGFGFQLAHQRTNTAGGLRVRGMNDNSTWSSWATVYTSLDFTNNSANWNTAYGWGDHAGLYATTGHAHNYYIRSNADDSFSGTLLGSAQRMMEPNDYGKGVYGKYSSTHFQHVWGMGSSWHMSTNGTSLGNFYGIAYTHPNVGAGSQSGLSHQTLFVENGVPRTWIGQGVRTVGDLISDTSVKAPNFYDLDNTGYYVNPAGISNLNTLSVNGDLTVSGTSNLNTLNVTNTVNARTRAVAITGFGSGEFTFYQASGTFEGFSGWHNYLISNHGDGSNYYNTMIAMPFWGPPRYSRREGNVYRGPYEFWTSERTIVSTFDITAPIFRDSDNTTYYLDPAGTSNLGSLTVNGSLYSTYINIADAIYHEGDTNTYIQFHSNDQWRVVTNGTERLEVSNTQVTVANSLQVNGSIYASQYIYHTGDIDTYMRFPSNDTISWNTAGSERMRIDSSGNVGIGTTSPGYKLDISDSSSGAHQIALRSTGSGSAGIWFDASNGDIAGSDYAWIRQNNDLTFEIGVDSLGGDMLFTEGGSERMRISSGKVGIGTTTPTNKLHVDGSIKWEGVGTAGILSGSEIDVSIAAQGSVPLILSANNSESLLLDPNDLVYKLGDYTDDNNGAYLEIDDDGSLATFHNSDLDILGGVYAENNVFTDGDLQTTGRVQIDGVKEYRESFTANGNSTLTFDVDIKSIGASGQPFEVFAGWTHYSTSYGCMFKAAYFQRSTIQSNITLVQTLINQSSLNAGFWSVSYVDANTIRITKNAGSHTSSGHGYIRVTHL